MRKRSSKRKMIAGLLALVMVVSAAIGNITLNSLANNDTVGFEPQVLNEETTSFLRNLGAHISVDVSKAEYDSYLAENAGIFPGVYVGADSAGQIRVYFAAVGADGKATRREDGSVDELFPVSNYTVTATFGDGIYAQAGASVNSLDATKAAVVYDQASTGAYPLAATAYDSTALKTLKFDMGLLQTVEGEATVSWYAPFTFALSGYVAPAPAPQAESGAESLEGSSTEEPAAEENEATTNNKMGRAFLNVAPLAGETGDTKNLVLDKTAKANNDGTYTITLDAYAKGIVTSTKERVPADIVLVLDESGSMAWRFEYEKIASTKWQDNATYGMLVTGQFVLLTRQWSYRDNAYIYLNGRDRYYGDLYKQLSTTTRQTALKNAVNTFLESVNQDAIANGVNHRVAIVGFSDSARVFNGRSTISDNYGRAWKDAGTPDGLSTLKSSVSRLGAVGATNSGDGMTKANSVMAAAPSTTDGKDRNQVVIMFTDGVPTTGSDFNDEVANKAIAQAKSLKDKKATVYSVGILGGANPGFDPTTNIDKYMNYVSSNYPAATSLSAPGTGGDYTKGYYLTATKSSELSEIFQKIAESTQTNTVTLNEKSVLTDIISDYFVLNSGSPDDVNVYTQAFAGYDADENPIWDERTLFEDAYVSIDTATKKISVTNFNYKENFITNDMDGNGTTGDLNGEKLVVEVTVKRAPSFIGGNDVETNNGAAIYADGTSTDPVKNFPEPDVDVSLLYGFEVKDHSIYVGDNWDEVVNLFTDDAGVPYKINNGPYLLGGTATNEFVTIVYTVTDEEDNVVGTYTVQPGQETGTWNPSVDKNKLLEENQTFTVTASVKPLPKAEGEPGVQSTSAEAEGKVYVYKPKVEVSDTKINLGDSTTVSERLDSTKTTWHCDTTDTELPELRTSAPVLNYEFNFIAGSNNEGADTYAPETCSDFTVTVKRRDKLGGTEGDITRYAIIENTKVISCADNHVGNDSEANHNFTIHVVVQMAKLTINKTINEFEQAYGDAIFTFNAKNEKTGVVYSGVIVIGEDDKLEGSVEIDLPVGKYTVTELRTKQYTLQGDNNITVSVTKEGGSVSFINHLTYKYYSSDADQVTNKVRMVDGEPVITPVRTTIKGPVVKVPVLPETTN
ncbi:vWA domain-containing protein [Ohessyouella blattaphilus]|uniref:VWA domain-containing protein n=1 Tax=Ohessyouella blattaphilus TaxID=2949333 RepID=A0ABT1EPI7_9FIRM|nr:vWA domain-containing protein [Ohessyouella blattaphilus]MCP1111197.1 VWA domain-containing protein [Ohessyouella blattaphilus]MCR8564591.1 VWA domain-containing protein [Ohessyouella blattaphilus]